MQLNWQFGRDTDNKISKESRYWLKQINLKRLWQRNLKRETEILLLGAMEKALNTISVRKIFLKDVSNEYRIMRILCTKHSTHCQWLKHASSERLQEKTWWDNLNTDYNFSKKFGIKVTKRWCEKRIDSIIENHVVKILWCYGEDNERMHGKWFCQSSR